MPPVWFSDSLDDAPIFDVCTGFEGGQVSNVRPSLLQPNQSALMQNFDITREGDAITRRGSTRLGGTVDPTFGNVKGLTYFDTPTFSYPVVATGSSPRYYNGTTWPLLSIGLPIGVSGLTANDVIFAQGVNKLYMADGFNPLWSWDGTTATNLGGATNAHPPAEPRWIIWHTDRLVVMGMLTEPDTMYFSQFLEGEIYDRASWSLRVGGGEGDLIVGGVSWTDFNIVVFKRRSIWLVNSDPTLAVSQFEVRRLTDAIGCIAPKTAIQVGNDIFFLSTQGIRSVLRTAASERQQDIGPALSQPVQDIIDRINPAVVFSNSSAIHWNNRYMISLPLDNSNVPNYVLVFNTLTNTWSGFWTGMGGKYFSYRLPAAGQPARMIFENGGFIHEWHDYILVSNEVTSTFQDNGVDIPCRILTRAMNFSDPVSPKTGLSCEVEYRSAGTLTGQLVKDGTNSGSAVTLSSSLTRKAFDVQGIGPFRELQLDLQSTAGKQTIKRIHASAFPDTMVLQS